MTCKAPGGCLSSSTLDDAPSFCLQNGGLECFITFTAVPFAKAKHTQALSFQSLRPLLFPFQLRFFGKRIQAGHQGQGGTIVPVHSDQAHIVHIGHRPFGPGRRRMGIVHRSQNDPGPGRVFLLQPFDGFFGGVCVSVDTITFPFLAQGCLSAVG